MQASISVRNVRIMLWTFRKLWRSMYESIRINQEGVAMLRELAAKKVPIILLPSHKSHIDYLLMSYVFCAHHLFPPYVVAGINLNFPLVSEGAIELIL